eukprot:3596855-Rhodomonas_salina.1
MRMTSFATDCATTPAQRFTVFNRVTAVRVCQRIITAMMKMAPLRVWFWTQRQSRSRPIAATSSAGLHSARTWVRRRACNSLPT